MPTRASRAVALPVARDLRARARGVFERTKLAGTPRARFLDDQRRRFILRLLPTLGGFAVVSGASALIDLFRPEARLASVTAGVIAIALAVLTFACAAWRKDGRVLFVIASLASVVLVVGWSLVGRLEADGPNPYTFASAFAATVIVLVVPLPPWFGAPLCALGAASTALACPDAPPIGYVIFALVAVNGVFIARARRKSALRAFKRVERLARSLTRVQRLQEELVVVEKLEALRVLVGGMAHELNNALAISVASTDQIVRVADKDPVAVVKAANRTQGGLLRIRQTIDRLRRFALAENAVLEPADLGAMLDFALESAIGRARSGVIVERDYDADVGPVECHVSALAEALFQVAKNAVESMPKGGTVRASVRRQGDGVVLTVSDEGNGISPDRLAKVFDPFFARESPETFTGRVLSPLPGRSGLGLSTVYGIVTSMGGKVEIRSDVGRGTEVSIRLPGRHATSRNIPSR